METPDPIVPALGFRRLTPLYDAVVGLTTREGTFKRALLAQAGIEPGWRVLDLGCGTGTLALWALQQQPEARLVGLDADPEILAIARRKAEAEKSEVEFREGFSFQMPFADASFDSVLSSLFFHHLPPVQKTATLKETLRVLRPGGRLHIADWGGATGVLSRLLFAPVQLLDGFANTRDHVAGRLPAYLREAGFTEVSDGERLLTAHGNLSLLSGRKAGG